MQRPCTYRKYTTVEKMNHINGAKKSDAPRSTSNGWMHEGRQNIEQLAEKDGLKELLFLDKQKCVSTRDAILHTPDFFMNTIHEKKSLGKQFKKQRAEMLLMVDKLKPFVALEELLDTLGISRQTYTTLQNKLNCKLSPGNTCLKSALNQFTNALILDMQRYYFNNEAYADFSLSDLFARLRHDKIIFISYPKFREIAVALGEHVKRKRKYKAIKKVGRKASQPNELLHADKTVYKLSDGKKVWIYLICDNYSRFILAAHVSYSSRSKESLHTLKMAIDNNHLNTVCFDYLTDNGSENKYQVKEFIATQPNIKHKIAQTHIAPYSNSMIEAVNKYFKNDILLRKEFKTIEELIAAVSVGVDKYNNRHRKFLNGGTPNDFYFGNEPDEIEYDTLYKESTKKRMQENKEYNCLTLCQIPLIKTFSN